MDPNLAQFLALGFFLAIGLTAFELNASLKPPFCAECAHCRAERDEKRRRQAELREHFAWDNGLWDRDDDVRR